MLVRRGRLRHDAAWEYGNEGDVWAAAVEFEALKIAERIGVGRFLEVGFIRIENLLGRRCPRGFIS